MELFRLYGNGDLTEEAPLMSFRGKGGWEIWSRGRATKCLRDGTASVAKRWREEEKGAGARLIPEEFALHSGRIGGATKLAARGVPEAVITKEGRWSSDSFMMYVSAKWRTRFGCQRFWSTGHGSFRDNRDKGLDEAEWDKSPLPVNLTTAWGTAIGTQTVRT